MGKLKQLNNLLKTILGIAYVIYILFMNRIIKNGRPPMAHKSNADKKLNVRQKAWKCNIHKALNVKCLTELLYNWHYWKVVYYNTCKILKFT